MNKSMLIALGLATLMSQATDGTEGSASGAQAKTAEQLAAEASAAGDLINRATEALGESVKGVIRDVTPRPKLR